MSNKEDPMNILYENDMIRKVGNGLFVLKGKSIIILNDVNQLICSLANQLGAEFINVPVLLSEENTLKTEYTKSFKDQAIMTTDKEMVSPTVCYHYFSSLKDNYVKENTIICALSQCTRREKGELKDLSRLTNFTMREIVFMGSEDYCIDIRNKILEGTKKILNERYDMSYKISTASDIFFGEDNTLKEKAQLMNESKYEIRAFIPYKKDSISIASFNLHGSIFYDRFNIKPKMYSGCVGWGYERMLYALIAQKGESIL